MSSNIGYITSNLLDKLATSPETLFHAACMFLLISTSSVGPPIPYGALLREMIFLNTDSNR